MTSVGICLHDRSTSYINLYLVHVQWPQLTIFKVNLFGYIEVKYAIINFIYRKEVNRIRLAALARATTTSPFFAAAKIVVYLTVITYVMTGNTIDASTVFVVVGLYGPIRLSVTLILPWGIQMMAEAHIAILRRIFVAQVTEDLFVTQVTGNYSHKGHW